MPDELDPETLVVYSDYVCPFCYLGKRSLETCLDELDDAPEIEWRPFDLRGHRRGPDGGLREDVDDGKDEAYYRRARENVERLAAEYDVDMTLELPETVDSWNAHKLALAAGGRVGTDALRELHDAIFEALWSAGRNIGDIDVLVGLAVGCGLEESFAREAIDDTDGDLALGEDFAEASERGIMAVPTFIYQGYGLRGAVPPERLRRFIEGRPASR